MLDKETLNQLVKDLDRAIFKEYFEKTKGEILSFFELCKENGLSIEQAIIDTLAFTSYITLKYSLLLKALSGIGFDPDKTKTKEELKSLFKVIQGNLGE